MNVKKILNLINLIKFKNIYNREYMVVESLMNLMVIIVKELFKLIIFINFTELRQSGAPGHGMDQRADKLRMPADPQRKG